MKLLITLFCMALVSCAAPGFQVKETGRGYSGALKQRAQIKAKKITQEAKREARQIKSKAIRYARRVKQSSPEPRVIYRPGKVRVMHEPGARVIEKETIIIRTAPADPEAAQQLQDVRAKISEQIKQANTQFEADVKAQEPSPMPQP